MPHRNRCKVFASLSVCIAMVLGVVSDAVAEPLQVQFDDGISALQVDAHDFLADAAVTVTRVVVADAYRDRHNEPPEKAYAGVHRTFENADVAVLESRFDPETNTLIQSFAWGTVSITYRPSAEKLDIDVKVANTSGSVIELVELTLMELQLTEKPEIDRVSSIIRFHSDTNIGGFDVRRARHAGGQLVFVSTTPNQPVRQLLAAHGADRLRLTVSAGNEKGGREVYHGIWDSMPIRAGETDTYRLSLRFGAADADSHAMVEDLWRAFGEAFPPAFIWQDRRPLGEMHVADSRRTPENPRAWNQGFSMPRGWNLADENSHQVFYDTVLANAERHVRIARQMGLQGIIAWQIEGMAFDSPAYYGEPRVLPYVAPEVDAVIDEYFRTFTDAGLRVGLTIRHQLIFPRCAETGQVVPWEDYTDLGGVQYVDEIPEIVGDIYDADEAWCPLTRFDNKITYAKARWGATLFYVDANSSFWRPRDATAEGGGWDRRFLSAELFAELQRRHPDCLIIPEHQYPQYFAHGAQYRHPPGWGRATGPDIRTAYPDAASIIKVTDRNVIYDNLDHYVRAVENGDMQFAMAWYGGDNELIHTVYGTAMESAPFRITVSDAGIVLNDQRMGSADALQQTLADALKDRPPLRERRAFVRYAEDTEVAALQAVLAAIVKADGIIGWTQLHGASE